MLKEAPAKPLRGARARDATKAQPASQQVSRLLVALERLAAVSETDASKANETVNRSREKNINAPLQN